jgi:hypothetical protein
MRRAPHYLLVSLLLGALSFPATAAADKLECKNHKASGEGGAPASLSEDSSFCTMTFGSGGGSSGGNTLLSGLLQNAPQEARTLHFMEDRARNFRQQFNITVNGPFDDAVVFFQALRVFDSMRGTTSASDALDALFYVIAGSAADRYSSQYRRLLEAYWSNRSAMSSSLGSPLDLISRGETTNRSFGPLNLTLGAGCFIAEIEGTRFVASIAQSLRADFKNCRSPS